MKLKSMLPPALGIAAAIAAVSVLSACGGGAGGPAQSPTPGLGPRAQAQRTAAVALASPAPCIAPSAAAPPADATALSVATGDVNGDGAPDQISTYLSPSAGKSHVRIALASGYALDDEISDSGASVHARAIGGYDIDGDGTDEAFVVVGSGAGADLIGLYDLDITSCTLARVVLATGEPATFPVGAAAVAIRGLVCINAGPAGQRAITRTSGTSSDGKTYTGVSETYTLTGNRLSAGSPLEATFTGPTVRAAASLRCGSLALP